VVVRGSCFSEEGGIGLVLLPAPPRPKPIALGYLGAGSCSVRGIFGIVVGSGGEGEGGRLALVVGRVVLVVDLVRSFGLARCGSGELLEDKGVAHRCGSRFFLRLVVECFFCLGGFNLGRWSEECVCV